MVHGVQPLLPPIVDQQEQGHHRMQSQPGNHPQVERLTIRVH
jgi:hypothetical protein